MVYADESIFKGISNDECLQQVANVAHLEGIVRCSIAMPDIHWGYGFPIGGTAATDPSQGGVISPGGVGYDINCGVRVARTNLKLDDVKKNITGIAAALFSSVPAGLGSSGAIRKLVEKELKDLNYTLEVFTNDT